MTEALLAGYNWIKALHILAVIFWMAGLLYLPRLFVYHAMAEAGSPQAETFKTMERRLLRGIMNPAMIAAWTFGLLMLWANPALFSQGWMHVKLLGIVLMTGAHMYYAAARKRFERGDEPHTHVFWRWVNEAPAVLAIVIVIMAVVEPF